VDLKRGWLLVGKVGQIEVLTCDLVLQDKMVLPEILQERRKGGTTVVEAIVVTVLREDRRAVLLLEIQNELRFNAHWPITCKDFL
jgi:hypothetical protein